MMHYELISEEECAKLPEDKEQCFVEFEAICRRNMNKMVGESNNHSFDITIHSQYMAAVSAVAAECGIPNLHISDINFEDFYPGYNQFLLAVQAEVARIRIRRRNTRLAFSVQLTSNTNPAIF